MFHGKILGVIMDGSKMQSGIGTISLCLFRLYFFFSTMFLVFFLPLSTILAVQKFRVASLGALV